MKRPQTKAIFAHVKTSTKETASNVLDFVIKELKGQLSSYYYARMRYDEEGDVYYFSDETLKLGGQEELFRRIERDGGSMWRMMLSMGFAPAETKIAVFSDVVKPSETTLLLLIDPEITRWVEIEAETRAPFALFLARVAKAIGSTSFVSGPYIDEWRPLDFTKPLNYTELGSPYVVGWKSGTPEESKLIADFKIKNENVFMTTLKYKFVDFFPSIS